MVTKILLLMVLFSSFALADCTTDWICDEWSECSIVGYNTRSCEDHSLCADTESKPIEIKRCTDDDSYVPENVVVETVAPEPVIAEPELIMTETSEPNLFIGLGIIAFFIIVGIIIGRFVLPKN